MKTILIFLIALNCGFNPATDIKTVQENKNGIYIEYTDETGFFLERADMNEILNKLK